MKQHYKVYIYALILQILKIPAWKVKMTKFAQSVSDRALTET